MLKIWDVDALGDAMSGHLRTRWAAYRRLKALIEKNALDEMRKE